MIAGLCDLARGTLVVLALRADFYGQAIRYPGLRRALQERHVVLGPITVQQVRDAIVRPAKLAHVGVDDELVAMLLGDLAPRGRGSDAGHEPGALPLLSHALLATWEHSHGETLAVSDYVASGGIKDALARTADHAYESLDAGQRELSRELFLRLVHVSEEMAPSRASVALDDLPGARQSGEAERVLATFVGERMITVGADTAQITHDALLTAWPRLRSWIEEDTGQLRDRSRIQAVAQVWVQEGKEEALLWRGSRLALAREWATVDAKRTALPELALSFVDACVAAAAAGERAARRRTRWLKSTVAVLAALVIAVAGLSVFGFTQRGAARAAAGRAMAEANLANSRDVAFTAERIRGQDPAVAAQLSVSADEFARTPQAAASLLESSGSASVARIHDSAGIVQWTAVSPNRRLAAAVGDDGTLRLWNVALPGHPQLIGNLVAADSKEPLYAAAFSPNGTLLVAAGANGLVRLWNVSGTKVMPQGQLLDGAGNVYSLGFGPDSAMLAAASTNGTIRLWRVSNSAQATPEGVPLPTPGTYPNSVAFSPDGQTLAAGTEAGTVWLWRLPGTGNHAGT
ncbi:MAG: WD40 repeat domain-containing protein, partial [Trebonia sp.]